MIQIDDGLLPYATEGQLKIIEALRRHNGVATSAAADLKVSGQHIGQSMRGLIRRATKLGYAPAQTPYMAQLAKKFFVIPDIQAKPGIDMKYIHCIGEYGLAKKPTHWIMLGDWADMPSLSSYDKGRRSYEGARYKNDIEASITAMEILLDPMKKYNRAQKALGLPLYEPIMIMLLGNHEDRINRATQLDPMLYGTISTDDLKFREFGWEVHDFLEVVVLDGIAFSHYFVTGLMSKACGTAQQQLTKMHMSCIAGHQQGRQVVTTRRADGRLMTSMIVGSAYDYDMDYLGRQANRHWRGVLMLHNILDGEFDEVCVPTEYLKKRYGQGVGSMVFAPMDKAA
jgi:hypothetical protein